MNRVFLPTFLVFTITLSSFAGAERLIGSWKSNKSATVAHLRINTRLTSAQIDKISTVLGQMVIVVDTNTMTLKHGDWTFTSNYRIVEEKTNAITVEAQDPQTKKLIKSTLELDRSGRGFWIADDKIEGFKERFDKLAAK
jgi:hypothetical protein